MFCMDDTGSRQPAVDLGQAAVRARSGLTRVDGARESARTFDDRDPCAAKRER
jgi:hypothetical protein